jgi:hypothetical protein
VWIEAEDAAAAAKKITLASSGRRRNPLHFWRWVLAPRGE